MKAVQPGILAEETKLARYLSFSINNNDTLKTTLLALKKECNIGNSIIGFGYSLVSTFENTVAGHKIMPAMSNNGIDCPSTSDALWIWLRGNDRGELFHRSRNIERLLSPAFDLVSATDSFQHDTNRDLSGYEDGTENPNGEEAIKAAIVQNSVDGMTGSSFVAVQKWVHDFSTLNQMSTEEKDDAIGRHIADNEEFDAPIPAHVKRSAQEDFAPEAFMLRRSMPWVDGMEGGLLFVAFGHSFDAFEAIMKRMIGIDDDIQDAIFKFTRPITGSYYWCPPVIDGKLDFTALGI